VLAAVLLAGVLSAPAIAAPVQTPQGAPHAEATPTAPQGGPSSHPTDQPTEAGADREAAGHAGGHGEGGGQEAESPWTLIARLFNFAVLAGALVYLLRSPLGAFLESRRIQVRSDLDKAAETRQAASSQLAHVEARLKALPEELETLKRHGTTEIAAEEARIRAAAEQERVRLLDQARREIDRRVHVAERELTKRAGDLAVDLATVRAKQAITEADQQRLVDRYLEQVRPDAPRP